LLDTSDNEPARGETKHKVKLVLHPSVSLAGRDLYSERYSERWEDEVEVNRRARHESIGGEALVRSEDYKPPKK
jgi:hypothetical protein